MEDNEVTIGGVRTDVAASARAYGWMLGGKDNFAVDREFIIHHLEQFPMLLDNGRQNRLFLPDRSTYEYCGVLRKA